MALRCLRVSWRGLWASRKRFCIGTSRPSRRWHVVVPFAVIFSALVAYLFNGVLGVYFEPGLFGKLTAFVA
ncbi:MAG: hypothetical protein ACR2RL_23220 [Gammaproteobacteria bacterium]